MFRKKEIELSPIPTTTPYGIDADYETLLTFKLGDRVKETVTEVEGIAVSILVVKYNCPRVCIQRVMANDVVPEPMWFDITQVIKIGSSDIKVVPTGWSKFEIGYVVKDKFSKLKGMVTGRQYHVNGCIRIGVSSDEVKDGIPVGEVWLPEGQLEVLKAVGIESEKKVKPNGGPMNNRIPRVVSGSQSKRIG
jgi:hypothetical protein